MELLTYIMMRWMRKNRRRVGALATSLIFGKVVPKVNKLIVLTRHIEKLRLIVRLSESLVELSGPEISRHSESSSCKAHSKQSDIV